MEGDSRVKPPGGRTIFGRFWRLVADAWFLGVGVASGAAFVFGGDAVAEFLSAP